jgi:hypothetical protein
MKYNRNFLQKTEKEKKLNGKKIWMKKVYWCTTKQWWEHFFITGLDFKKC